MKNEDFEKVSAALEIVAMVNGVSVEEVRSEIAAALLVARNSKDQSVQKKWEAMFPNADPPVEEVIAALAEEVKKNQ